MAERLTPFGKYFLLERVNVGGMAEVFKAKTVGVEGFEKVVAIKRILPSVAEDEEFIRMFVDEAKITSQLSHANLAQTFDLGKIDDTYYIAMEYVPGRDLRAVFERLKRRGEHLPLPLAAYAVARVCEGLDYAHRKHDAQGRELHIVHRDVSPQNIILSYEGEVKLIDFGIAKAANKITRTQAGILKGKFGYMSPEQVRGLPLDGRSDIFAAGVVLYELCTGERLFTGTSDYAVLEKVQQARVTPPSQLDPAIPLRLERIILKALAREPQDRYQQAGDLAADLTRFLLETNERNVTRDDVAAFMRTTFPPEPVAPPQPEARRPGPQPPLFSDSDPERTDVGPSLDTPRAEIIVRSRQLAARSGTATVPSSPDLVQPGPEDQPTRPISMDELAAAERAYAQQQGQRTLPSVLVNGEAAAPEPFGKSDQPTITPIERPQQRAPVPETQAPEPSRPPRPAEASRPPPPVEPAREPRPPPPRIPEPPRAVEPPPPEPARAPPPVRPPEPRRPPPFASPVEVDLSVTPREARRPAARPTAPPVPIESQETQVKAVSRPPPAPLPPPTAPFGADETTDSTVRRSRFLRRVQIAIGGAALAIAAFVVLSPTHHTTSRSRDEAAPAAAGNFGSLTVTVDPKDAVLLLDGAQVKEPGDARYLEPHLAANTDHVLLARRAGYSEQQLKISLTPGEQKQITMTLAATAGELIVLSSPPGATVYVDGERRGLTPAFLNRIDPARTHAVSVEKKCYRSWQRALTAGAQPGEIAATLEPRPGTCARTTLETAGMPAGNLPEAAQSAQSLGFLSLGSRPAANVLVDGVDLGVTTPLVAWPLGEGTHQVRLIAGAKSRSLTVGIRAGETQSELVDLNAAEQRARR